MIQKVTLRWVTWQGNKLSQKLMSTMVEVKYWRAAPLQAEQLPGAIIMADRELNNCWLNTAYFWDTVDVVTARGIFSLPIKIIAQSSSGRSKPPWAVNIVFAVLVFRLQAIPSNARMENGIGVCFVLLALCRRSLRAIHHHCLQLLGVRPAGGQRVLLERTVQLVYFSLHNKYYTLQLNSYSLQLKCFTAPGLPP